MRYLLDLEKKFSEYPFQILEAFYMIKFYLSLLLLASPLLFLILNSDDQAKTHPNAQ